MLVSLRLMPNVLQGAWYSQNWHHVVAYCYQLLNQVICTRILNILFLWCFWLRWGKKTFTGKRLSQVSMYVALFTLVGSYIVSNQIIAGSIMVRHMKLIIDMSLPLRVYYLMRCTHNALWGVIMNSFDITWSYFDCVSCFWQDLQDLTLLDGMCIPFQYFTDFVVSLRLEWLGCRS